MSRYVEVTDDLIINHLVLNPAGHDDYGDARNYPHTFLKGYRDAESGIEDRSGSSHWSMAEGNAYELGRYEYLSG